MKIFPKVHGKLNKKIFCANSFEIYAVFFIICIFYAVLVIPCMQGSIGFNSGVLSTQPVCIVIFQAEI